ncbi:MAG TPA: HXXEE domain-containing protein [Sphingomonadales bacterium]|nr:HXXEE domain-containing protein [Sphingomonadales bacterium]
MAASKTPKSLVLGDKIKAAGPNARAWLVLVAVLAVHVFDEAVTDFLPFYNGIVSSLKEKWGFFPMFAFPSVEAWLGALIVALTIGFALTGLVARGGLGIRVFVTFTAVMMVGNGLGHLLGSLYFGHPIPGFWSAWLVLPAALWMAYRGFTGNWSRRPR